ncbi:aldo/keto reductase [Fluviibacterium sp. DFM31]|uniref:Aldo/keto reductase n=1 Tax=Meridianimarinicoccus marinus TaxID=3231483 RepID=A0ABV3L6Q7_9RHOB
MTPDAVAPQAPTFPADWPAFGQGCSPLGDIFQEMGEPAARDLLETAWTGGIRYFDTAPWYGHGLSEHRLGGFLRQFDRRDFVLSTKVGRVYDPAPRGKDARINWAGGLNFAVRYDYSAAGFEAALTQSRLRLGLPVVDALVIHDLDRGYHGAAYDGHLRDLTDSGLAYLQDLRARGEIGAIGMGMNSTAEFAALAGEIDVDFFLVAIPYTLLDQDALDGPMATCLQRGIAIVIGAPFASGVLAAPRAPGIRYQYRPVTEEIRGKALAIEAVCARHGISLPGAALRFPLLHPAVVSVVPGVDGAAQLRANLDAMRPEPPHAMWAELKAAGLLRADAPTGG